MLFYIHCNPPKTTAQASLRIIKRRDGTQFVGRFEKSKGTQTKNELLTMLSAHAPATPFAGPVLLTIDWVYPFRKSEKKSNVAKGVIPCDTRPDCDNLAKLFNDCMTRLGFWHDDSQVYSLTFRKWWGANPGIKVEINEEAC